MNIKRKVDYCTLDIDYPKTALICFLFYTEGNIPRFVLPVSHIFSSIDEASYCTGKYIESAVTKTRAEIQDTTILIPLYFQSLYPLKKEFWKHPTQRYEGDVVKKMKMFLPVLEKPEFYKLLVTPVATEDNKWIFRAATPFYLSADNSVIEKFLLTSDWAIDERIKNAAFYTFGKSSSFNWKTKKITEVNEDNKEKLFQVN